LSRYTFTQNFIKLSAAVHQLSCYRGKKRSDSAENNTVVASTSSSNVDYHKHYILSVYVAYPTIDECTFTSHTQMSISMTQKCCWPDTEAGHEGRDRNAAMPANTCWPDPV